MSVRSFDAFLSYSSADRDWVVALKRHLEGRGLRVWMDIEQIPPGEMFVTGLERGLDASRTMVLIVSPESVASGWVQEEYARAMSLTKAKAAPLRIIPVILRDAVQPGFLESRQRVDFRDADAFEAALSELIFGITGKNVSEQLIRGAHDRAVVDRRVATEILLLFSGAANEVHADPRTRAVLVAASGVYHDLLIENLYGSTLAALVRNSEPLQRQVTFMPPVETQIEDADLSDDVIDAWADHPEFGVLAASYDQRKGGSGGVRDAADYIFRMFAAAHQIGASIVVHPARWPLFRWCIERAGSLAEVVAIPASPSDSRIAEARRDTMQSMAAVLQPRHTAALFRYGPMPFPLPPEIAEHYDAAIVPETRPMIYEFCAPAAEEG
ncbi:MAG: hypothetical protein QOH21_1929 [Acidobacteriota bacterium]|jgi:hypothetical protein|nr:hypothetical protein [Acidobacteriota bacterium]